MLKQEIITIEKKAEGLATQDSSVENQRGTTPATPVAKKRKTEHKPENGICSRKKQKRAPSPELPDLATPISSPDCQTKRISNSQDGRPRTFVQQLVETAAQVAKQGAKFEESLKSQKMDDPVFRFLNVESLDHQFYLKCVIHFKNAEILRSFQHKLLQSECGDDNRLGVTNLLDKFDPMEDLKSQLTITKTENKMKFTERKTRNEGVKLFPKTNGLDNGSTKPEEPCTKQNLKLPSTDVSKNEPRLGHTSNAIRLVVNDDFGERQKISSDAWKVGMVAETRDMYGSIIRGEVQDVQKEIIQLRVAEINKYGVYVNSIRYFSKEQCYLVSVSPSAEHSNSSTNKSSSELQNKSDEPHRKSDESRDDWKSKLRVSSRLTVFWGEKWYSGRVRAVLGDRILVNYDKFQESWDEWLPLDSNRIAKYTPQFHEELPPSLRFAEFHPGQELDAHDMNENWFRSEVMEVYQKCIKVHFDGWDSDFDEIIKAPSDRIAPAGKYSDPTFRAIEKDDEDVTYDYENFVKCPEQTRLSCSLCGEFSASFIKQLPNTLWAQHHCKLSKQITYQLDVTYPAGEHDRNTDQSISFVISELFCDPDSPTGTQPEKKLGNTDDPPESPKPNNNSLSTETIPAPPTSSTANGDMKPRKRLVQKAPPGYKLTRSTPTAPRIRTKTRPAPAIQTNSNVFATSRPTSISVRKRVKLEPQQKHVFKGVVEANVVDKRDPQSIADLARIRLHQSPVMADWKTHNMASKRLVGETAISPREVVQAITYPSHDNPPSATRPLMAIVQDEPPPPPPPPPPRTRKTRARARKRSSSKRSSQKRSSPRRSSPPRFRQHPISPRGRYHTQFQASYHPQPPYNVLFSQVSMEAHLQYPPQYLPHPHSLEHFQHPHHIRPPAHLQSPHTPLIQSPIQSPEPREPSPPVQSHSQPHSHVSSQASPQSSPRPDSPSDLAPQTSENRNDDSKQSNASPGGTSSTAPKESLHTDRAKDDCHRSEMNPLFDSATPSATSPLSGTPVPSEVTGVDSAMSDPAVCPFICRSCSKAWAEPEHLNQHYKQYPNH